MSKPRSRRQRGKPSKQLGSAGMRWLLIVLVLVAVLVILLRMAEFSGHRAPRARHRMVSEMLAPSSWRDFHRTFLPISDCKEIVNALPERSGMHCQSDGHGSIVQVRSVVHTHGFSGIS